MKPNILIFFAASMLCSINSVHGMIRVASQRADLNELEFGPKEPDTTQLGLDLIKLSSNHTGFVSFISGIQLQKKIAKKQSKLEKALERVARKWETPRITLQKLHLDALRNRVASERLIIKEH